MTDPRPVPVPALFHRLPARVWALLAAVATVLGAVLIVTAVVATRRLWFGGYVSEAGVASSGHAPLYRVGILGLSLGQLLLGVALLVGVRLIWVAGLLGVAGVFGVLSATVSCSAGCPLPPHESTTAGDLVHAGASIIAVAAICLAVLALAYLSGPAPGRLSFDLLDRLADRVRAGAAIRDLPGLAPAVPAPVGLIRASRVAAVTLVPLVALNGLSILVVGRGQITGLLERAVLIAAIVWALAMCRRLATSTV